MNKTFLSLALVAAFSISFSVFAADDKKVEVKVSDIPAHALEMVKELTDKIVEAKEDLKGLQEAFDNAKKAKAELKKDEDSKDADANLEKATKELVEAQTQIAELEGFVNAANLHLDAKYSKSLMNKVTAPARYVARLIANNNKVALALEVTGVAGISYVIYKSFFAQEEDDEDSL